MIRILSIYRKGIWITPKWPIYSHDAINAFYRNTPRHSKNFGTNYCTYTRSEYKILSDVVNHKLHKSSELLFNKFNCLLINPTPRWEFQGSHVDPRTGLPYLHQVMVNSFFSVVGRIMCERRFCTLGPLSTRNIRRADDHLVHGCSRNTPTAHDGG